MTKFNTKYTGRNKRSSVTGSAYQIEYQLVIDDDGHEKLKPNGMTNLHDEIQSHRASVDINLIIERFTAGDDSALNAMNGFYADITELPKDLMNLMNMNLEGERLFNQMPTEVKDVFGNSYLQFLAHPEELKRFVRMPAENLDLKKEVKENGEQE